MPYYELGDVIEVTYTISQVVGISDEVEEAEDVAGYFAEASHCQALSFFGISYDDGQSFSTARPITDEDIQVIHDYLDFHESNHTCFATQQAEAYDNWTANSRGADDGTFDYCGSFMLFILENVQKLQNA